MLKHKSPHPPQAIFLHSTAETLCGRFVGASASFPLFSQNLNTGGHNEKETRYLVAEQTIHHDKRYPSHILLPVIPDVDRR